MYLEAFHAWIEQEKPTWEARDLRLDISPPTLNRNKNSMVVNFISATVSAHLTVWDSGEWEMEALTSAMEDGYQAEYRPASSLGILIDRVSMQLRKTGVIQ